ncbi:MAG: cupin domain-containing protein [Planctomycetota bacterium]|jgi:uncharacterized RmlC-like cupin family protein
MAENKAFVVELNHEKGYQRLIPGAPTTHGMKSGRVYLEPEEEVVVGEGRICYIPPQTEHNILNTSTDPLVYIFCVAPAR